VEFGAKRLSGDTFDRCRWRGLLFWSLLQFFGLDPDNARRHDGVLRVSPVDWLYRSIGPLGDCYPRNSPPRRLYGRTNQP